MAKSKRKLRKERLQDRWTPWEIIKPDDAMQETILRAGGGRDIVPDEVWRNNVYEVWVRLNVTKPDAKWPQMTWLSIKRLDRGVMRDWRHLQRIKNDIVGPEHEAVELFPAESRLTDTSNQYHLWVLSDKDVRFPFGWRDRVVMDASDGTTLKGKQRPFHKPPEDCLDGNEADRIIAERAPELRKDAEDGEA
jgi:hypothetical protein